MKGNRVVFRSCDRILFGNRWGVDSNTASQIDVGDNSFMDERGKCRRRSLMKKRRSKKWSG